MSTPLLLQILRKACLFVVSLRARHCVTWLALRMIIIPWFDHQDEHFSCNLEVQSKDFFPYVKITCPPVEKG